MGCVQGRDGESPRSGGSTERSDAGGVAAPRGPDAAFLAEVHRKRVAENNPQAAYQEKEDALGRYEAAAEARGVQKPFTYRQWDAATLRAETAKLKGGSAAVATIVA